jgi:hypothetical protein
LKTLVEYFSKKKIVFKFLEEIDKTLLKTRKKIAIFSATDTSKCYHSMYRIQQKSRFLRKNVEELIVLDQSLQNLVNHNFKYKHLIIMGPICSKSTTLLKNMGWQIHNDFV